MISTFGHKHRDTEITEENTEVFLCALCDAVVIP
jgi:hypothetical protein